MSKYINRFRTVTDFENSDKYFPSVVYCNDTPDIVYYADDSDAYEYYSEQYLTFELITEGTITITSSDSSVAGKIISYSIDGGSTWNSITTSVYVQSLGTSYSAGQKILLKGLNNTYGTSSYRTQFGSTAQFKVYGNIMSLIYGDSFEGKTSFPSGSTYNFNRLFYESTGLVDASNLILPATTLADSCYNYMFYGCINLIQAPELHATTLVDYCYNHMFQSCTSLTTAPELPATTLAQYCYQRMFYGCTSLTQAPELPATTLAQSCYLDMFRGCTSLIQAPELPATTLSSSCYNSMFYGCTNLIQAPELPATTLANYCYQNMFRDCTKLNYIKALFTTTPSVSYTDNWVNNVAATGIFIKNNAATWNATGVSGVPSGWTVQTASE